MEQIFNQRQDNETKIRDKLNFVWISLTNAVCLWLGIMCTCVKSEMELI